MTNGLLPPVPIDREARYKVGAVASGTLLEIRDKDSQDYVRVWSDEAMTTEVAQPLIADGRGEFPYWVTPDAHLVKWKLPTAASWRSRVIPFTDGREVLGGAATASDVRAAGHSVSDSGSGGNNRVTEVTDALVGRMMRARLEDRTLGGALITSGEPVSAGSQRNGGWQHLHWTARNPLLTTPLTDLTRYRYIARRQYEYGMHGADDKVLLGPSATADDLIAEGVFYGICVSRTSMEVIDTDPSLTWSAGVGAVNANGIGLGGRCHTLPLNATLTVNLDAYELHDGAAINVFGVAGPIAGTMNGARWEATIDGEPWGILDTSTGLYVSPVSVLATGFCLRLADIPATASTLVITCTAFSGTQGMYFSRLGIEAINPPLYVIVNDYNVVDWNDSIFKPSNIPGSLSPPAATPSDATVLAMNAKKAALVDRFPPEQVLVVETNPIMNKDPRHYSAVDKSHPSAEGHRLISEAIVQAMRTSRYKPRPVAKDPDTLRVHVTKPVGTSQTPSDSGDTCAPLYVNGWVENATGEGASYWRDQDGRVHLSGNVKSGSLGTIFTLNPGWRPKKVLKFSPVCGTLAGRLRIDTNGDVVLEAASASPVYLAGISFLAEQ